MGDDTREMTVRLERDAFNLTTSRLRAVPSLVVVQGVDRGEYVTITNTPLVIGRGEQCDFRVQDDGISRRHAQIVRDAQGRFVVEDLNSTNGVFVRGQRVHTHVLKENDKVLLGRRTILKFVYQDALDQNFARHMYESAVKDGLTGIFNRKHFDERIVSELSFSARHKTALSVLIFDLDHFKRINDTYGHHMGDAVLIKVTAAVRETLREEDFFARYGGEEFVILARDIGESGALALAERIRRIVQDLRIHTPEGIRVPVTLSIGVVTYHGDGKPSPGDLVSAADANLYAAKEGGRNRVVAAPYSPRSA